MSVQHNTYIVWGAKFDYTEDDDKLDPYHDNAFQGIHHHNGVCVLSDGYDGKYTVIGRVLAKTDGTGMFNCDPIDVSDLIWKLRNDRLIEDEIYKITGQKVAPTLLVFTHYR